MAEKGFPVWVQIGSTLFIGVTFGIAAEKARVIEPRIVRAQMVMENFTLMKMFLSASATSMVVFSLLSMIPATRPCLYKAWDKFVSNMKDKTLFANSIGAFICGCGMTLAGSCPGIVFCQVGAAVPNAVYTLLGALLAAALYPKACSSFPRFLFTSKPENPKRLDEIFFTPLFILALPLAACLGVVVFGIEEFFPWTTEIQQAGSGIFGVLAWPPFVAGSLIGCTQFLSVAVTAKTLGLTGVYSVLVAQLQTYLHYCQDYFCDFTSGLCNYLQVLNVTGFMIGAFLSAHASNSLGAVSGVNPILAFAGGILMIGGAKLGAGCTSGHGLSGMAFLAVPSLVATPAMFGGAILTGCLMKYGLSVPDLPPVDINALNI